jgi:hypothetical protein
LPQVFSKILKCIRNITKNVITTDSFAAKVVIVIDNMWLDSAIPFLELVEHDQCADAYIYLKDKFLQS